KPSQKGPGVTRQRPLTAVVEYLDLWPRTPGGRVAQVPPEVPREVGRDHQRGAHGPRDEGVLELLAGREGARVEGAARREIGDEATAGGCIARVVHTER